MMGNYLKDKAYVQLRKKVCLFFIEDYFQICYRKLICPHPRMLRVTSYYQILALIALSIYIYMQKNYHLFITIYCRKVVYGP